MTNSAYNAHTNPLFNPLPCGTWSSVHDMAGGQLAIPMSTTLETLDSSVMSCMHHAAKRWSAVITLKQ
jgi:hypothetical protein